MTPARIRRELAQAREDRRRGRLTDHGLMLRLVRAVEDLAAVVEGDPLGEGLPVDQERPGAEVVGLADRMRSAEGADLGRPVAAAIAEDETTLAQLRTERALQGPIDAPALVEALAAVMASRGVIDLAAWEQTVAAVAARTGPASEARGASEHGGPVTG